MNTKTMFAVFFASLGFLPLAAAGEGMKGENPFAACEEDKARLCAGAEKIAECMIAHEKEVSWECRAVLEKKKAHMGKKGGKALKKGAWPCDADKERLCSDVPWGGGRVQACLAENEAELSKECRAALGEKKGHESRKPKH
jgi:hypothetical protein